MPRPIPRLVPLGLVAALFSITTLTAAPAVEAVGATPASEASEAGDPARGEAIFFEHAFGANAASVPLKVFEALPDVAPRFAPEALAARYGLLYKPGRALPIGFVSTPALGVERLSTNCSVCHTGLVDGQLVAGMPNLNLRLQDLEEELTASLASPELAADRLLPAIKARHADLSWGEEAMIRTWLAAAQWQAPQRKPSPHRAGPGRFDLLQTFKVRLGLPKHEFNAQADIPSLFGVRMLERYPRDGALGGDQDLVRYLIVRLAGDNTPLVDGKPPQWVRDLNRYMHDLTPPRYPYALDAKKVAVGKRVFGQTCSPCHGTYEPGAERHPNRIVPIDAVGTDPWRVRVWDQAAIDYARRDPVMKQLDLQPGVGILPPSLRGVWATPPYLHNGSVPTLYGMLSDPASRPKAFYRGENAPYDPVRGGLASIDAPANPAQFRFDTTIPGNGNQGHPFGMPLTEAERLAVIEYLKTL